MSKERLYICEVDRTKICNLIDSTTACARNIVETYKANEITTLEFDLPVVNGGKWINVANEKLVFYNNEYYIIKKPTFNHDEDGKLYVHVECKHYSDILANSIISTQEVTPMNIIDLMKMALLYDSDGVSQTGWTVGRVDVDKVVKRGLEAVEQSSFSILLTIAEKFGGIMIFDSVNMKVNVVPLENTERPDIDLRVSKNLKSVEISYDTSEMYTRLYCYGGTDDDGNELDIMSVNPTGKPYIDNFDYFKRLGYTDEFINAHKQYFVRTNLWRDSAYFDAQDLYNDGVKQAAKVSVPIVNISVTALDTTAFGNANTLTNLKVGDCIRVYDEDLGLDTLCNVISRTKEHEQPHLLNIDVTNSVTYHDTLSQLFTSVNTMSVVGTGSSGGGSGGDWHGNISVSDIKDLHLYYLTAEQIEAKYATIEYLNANYITANEIRANYIDAVSIAAQYATIGSLEAVEAKIKDLNVDHIMGKLAEFDQLFVDNGEFHKLVATDAEIEELKAGNITVTGKVTASEAEIETIKATYVQVGSFEAYKATIENLFASKAEIDELKVKYLEALKIETDEAKIKQLEALIANIGTLNAKLAQVEQLIASSIIVDSITGSQADIDELDANIAKIGTAIIDIAKIENLEVAKAEIDKLIANEITAILINVENLKAHSVEVEQLKAYLLVSKFGEFENLTAEKFNAAYADIENLDALVANINTILAGSIGTGVLQTIHLTADNMVVDDAIIKSAMIEDLDVSKLKAGTISTNKFTIQSDDGGIQIVGSTQQFTDENGKVRMQVGRDAQGNFNFIVIGEDGTTALYDHNGIKEGAVPDGLIVDKMVNDDANISGKKLNIDSVIETINEDGTKTINSTKIWVDETNQSIGASFKEINSKVDNIKVGAVNLIRNAKTMEYPSYGIRGIVENIIYLVDENNNYLIDESSSYFIL